MNNSRMTQTHLRNLKDSYITTVYTEQPESGNTEIKSHLRVIQLTQFHQLKTYSSHSFMHFLQLQNCIAATLPRPP